MLRPFKCSFCDKTYKTNGHLKDHIQVQHIKIRKFKCEICKSEFGRNSTLLAHLKTHRKKVEKSKNDYEINLDNITTRTCSKVNLISNTATTEEEKKFWNIDNEDLFSIAFGENEQNDLNNANHVFDLNFDQGNTNNNYINSSNNNSDNENALENDIIFF